MKIKIVQVTQLKTEKLQWKKKKENNKINDSITIQKQSLVIILTVITVTDT